MGMFGIFNIFKRKKISHVPYIERERLKNIQNAKEFLYDFVFEKAVDGIKESYVKSEPTSMISVPHNSIQYPQLSCLDCTAMNVVALEAVNDAMRSLQIKASKIEEKEHYISVTFDYSR